MKYVQVPEAIQLRNTSTGALEEFYSLKAYATKFWFDDHRWQTPPSNLARLVNVMKEFMKKPGEQMEFEDSDFAILHGIVEKPGMGINQVTREVVPMLPSPLVSLQLESYRQLVLTATGVKSEVAPP